MASYICRVLPVAEYDRLGLPLDTLPVGGFVVVVEKDGAIVGRWMAGTTVILEGLTITADCRYNPAVASRLLHGMLGELRARGVAAALTIVQDDAVARLAEHAEFVQVPGTLYQKDLR